MISKEIIQNNELPLYEVQEVSLLDAMLLLKGYGEAVRESSITRAAALLEKQNRDRSDHDEWSMTIS